MCYFKNKSDAEYYAAGIQRCVKVKVHEHS